MMRARQPVQTRQRPGQGRSDERLDAALREIRASAPSDDIVEVARDTATGHYDVAAALREHKAPCKQAQPV